MMSTNAPLPVVHAQTGATSTLEISGSMPTAYQAAHQNATLEDSENMNQQ
jgi:hypothetical protein